MAPMKIKALDILAQLSFWPNYYDILVLNYHSIVPNGTRVGPWEVEVSDFEQHIREIAKCGNPIVRLGDIPSLYKNQSAFKKNIIKPKVCLTFDDGFEDNYTLAAPILQKYGVTASFAVVSALIESNGQYFVSDDFRSMTEGGKKFMSAGMLEDLVNRGFEVVSHTMTHPNLNAVSNIDLFREIKESSDKIKEKFGTGQGIFVMAYGVQESLIMKKEVLRALSKYRFKIAALGRYGYLKFDRNFNPLDVPRIPVYGSDTFRVFKNKLSGKYGLVSRVYSLVKTFRGVLRNAN